MAWLQWLNHYYNMELLHWAVLALAGLLKILVVYGECVPGNCAFNRHGGEHGLWAGSFVAFSADHQIWKVDPASFL